MSVVKFIDRLHDALQQANMNVCRDGWDDYGVDKDGKRSETANDPCEWIDIVLEEKEGERFVVQFYFSNNSKTLDHVHVYKQKRKSGWKPEKLVASSRDQKPIPKVEKKENNNDVMSTTTGTIC